MFFVAVFLFILSVVFIGIGLRSSQKQMTQMGFIFLIAAAGATLITYLAFSAFDTL